MHSHIYRLGLVTATVLLSLTSIIKLPETPVNGAALAQTTINQERKNLALRLNKFGLEQFNTGQYQNALEAFEQALIIVRRIGYREGEGTILSNIGGVYLNLGQYPDALKYYEQSLIITKEVGDQAGVGTTLNNIGLVYDYIGQYAQALKYYEQALVIHKAVGNKLMEGTTLNNIGAIFRNQGQYADALKYYSQALVIAKEVSDKAGEGMTLNNIGDIYNNQAQYPQAMTYYEQALVIYKAVGDQAAQGTILNNIGLIYNNQGLYADALKYYSQALVIVKDVGNKAGEGITLNNIGLVYNNQRKYPDAEKILFSAIEVLESLRPGLTDASKIAIFETQSQTYRLLQYALIAQNKTNTALEIAERGRGRAFVELLAQRQSSNPNNQLTVKPPTIQQIQQIAKVQNATLVEYSIVKNTFKNQEKEESQESSLYIWVVKPTGEVAFKQVDLKSLILKDLVNKSRVSIGVRGRGIGVTPKTDAPTQARKLQQLHQILIQPIAKFLPSNPNERVIFIPQNELFLIPFVALQDEQGKYLIEKHTILTAPAIQVLQLTHQQRQQIEAIHKSPLQGKDVLVMGNPTMPSIPDSTGKLEQLDSLPGAEIEAKAIAQLFHTQAITGKDATKAAILQQLKTSRIVHLATHGLLDDFKLLGLPGAIALAPANNDNGLLTSSEIFDLKLNSELVVLSACDTGRGDIKGDGVIGLSRSLISAGVPSIIVSLWSIPDAPTAALMTEFYRQIQQNPDKAQALRQAMLTTMKQYPNPKDWAAFTLIGEAQ